MFKDKTKNFRSADVAEDTLRGDVTSSYHLYVIYVLLLLMGLWSVASFFYLKTDVGHCSLHPTNSFPASASDPVQATRMDAIDRYGMSDRVVKYRSSTDRVRREATESEQQRRQGGRKQNVTTTSQPTGDEDAEDETRRQRRGQQKTAAKKTSQQQSTSHRERNCRHKLTKCLDDVTSRGSGDQAQMNRVIHMHAPAQFARQHQSPPIVSFNNTRQDTVYRFWRKADWVPAEADDIFHLDEQSGHVTIKQTGLYMIYAQVVYHDLTGRWSYGVFIDNREKLKCLDSEQLRDIDTFHPTSHGVYQHCYTASVVYLQKYQNVHIRCMYGSRTILTQPEFTFWGIIKIS